MTPSSVAPVAAPPTPSTGEVERRCRTCDHVLSPVRPPPLVQIHHDRDAENPVEWGEWRVVSFSPRHTGFQDPERFENEHGQVAWWLRNKLRAGTAFLLSYYEHGQCQWSVSGHEGLGFEDVWDGVRHAGLLFYEGNPRHLPRGREARLEMAKNLMDIYTMWCNGDCYGYVLEDPETGEDLDSCWGYYGLDDVHDAINEALRAQGFQARDDLDSIQVKTYS